MNHSAMHASLVVLLDVGRVVEHDDLRVELPNQPQLGVQVQNHDPLPQLVPAHLLGRLHAANVEARVLSAIDGLHADSVEVDRLDEHVPELLLFVGAESHHISDVRSARRDVAGKDKADSFRLNNNLES